MIQVLKKSFLQPLFLFSSLLAAGQQVWPSPEVAQMYRHAQEYYSRGDYKDAVITYKQAIVLAPENIALYKELARSLYSWGNSDEAEETLKALETPNKADAECYQLLATIQEAEEKLKAAKTTLKKGIALFPGSGLLYHESGNLYEREDDPEDALGAWIDGIQQEPGYAPNYYEAAKLYLNTDDITWGLVYGEMYLDMYHDTTSDDSFKTLIFKSYKTMFDNIAVSSVSQFGNTKSPTPGNTFFDAVNILYTSLTPVISDGVTTDNLTMARTRFLMSWYSEYNSRYPFSLFAYWDELVKTGHFDIYDEWLFGKAESEQEYKAWNLFHDGDINRFISWRSFHPFHPDSKDFYNDKRIHGLFKHPKK